MSERREVDLIRVPLTNQPQRPQAEALSGPVTMAAFERRVEAEPDLQMSPIYWNCVLPQTAPGYFTWLIFLAFGINGSITLPSGRRIVHE